MNQDREIPVLRQDRLRRIQGSFSWIDHRFVHDGHMQKLSRDAIALYCFLVIVANHHGVSFWRYERMCQHLDAMTRDSFFHARQELLKHDLIAFKPYSPSNPNGFYQVLSLPQAIRALEPHGHVR